MPRAKTLANCWGELEQAPRGHENTDFVYIIILVTK